METPVQHTLNLKQIGVLIGPLRNELNTDVLAKRVYQLLTKVGIMSADIERISLNPQVGYAKVELSTKESENFAVRILRNISNVMSLYDLRHITAKPKNFRVERIFPKDSELKSLNGFSKLMVVQEHDSHHFVKVYNPLVDEACSMLKQHERAVKDSNLGEQYFELMSLSGSDSSSSSSVEFDKTLGVSKSRENITANVGTSTSELPTSTSTIVEQSEPVIKLDAKTSTALIVPCFYPGVNFYHRLQLLEWHETHFYFDMGHILIYDLRGFRVLVGKLICAFLNSNGGGAYFGVNKRGQIHGVYIDHNYEDALRVDIDHQIKLIQPIVRTSDYYVNFPKVMALTGYLQVNYKILEIKVKPVMKAQEMYEFKDVPYIWMGNEAVEYSRPSYSQSSSQSSSRR